ncbi:DUF3500 domain-containing protein [Methylocaldum sp.]|uniref:DUF3500 domain-containing protein n=1 Tax=Methylocaldum sp. TaxID=1969727 RepID=UPI002D48BDDD|nr:DUF3500 domain-containing protein [Methylocaldum sp.]HYE34365.1 DUF3500 domain-containing protein [Methylocaldum sp.]
MIAQATARSAQLALAFLDTLSPEQRSYTVLPFAHETLHHWSYFPRHRLVTVLLDSLGTLKRLRHALSPARAGEPPKAPGRWNLQGLAFRDMTPAQRTAAEALLRFSLSEAGGRKAERIMQLETVLRETGHFPRTLIYDPEQYAFSVFGDPRVSPWGWRLEGHHLVLHFMVITDGLVSVTPAFFGAHPAEVSTGHLKGLRTLAPEQDLGFQLLRSLTEEQRRQTIIASQAPADIITGPRQRETLHETAGLPLGKMNGSQCDVALTLIGEYVHNVRGEFAETQLRRIQEAGMDSIHFAWAGALEPGQGHYYRLHGPTVLIEYDNTQNNANHIHTIWRDPTNDYGTDYLREHYANSHPGHGHVHGGSR